MNYSKSHTIWRYIALGVIVNKNFPLTYFPFWKVLRCGQRSVCNKITQMRKNRKFSCLLTLSLAMSVSNLTRFSPKGGKKKYHLLVNNWISLTKHVCFLYKKTFPSTYYQMLRFIKRHFHQTLNALDCNNKIEDWV